MVIRTLLIASVAAASAACSRHPSSTVSELQRLAARSEAHRTECEAWGRKVSALVHEADGTTDGLSSKLAADLLAAYYERPRGGRQVSQEATQVFVGARVPGSAEVEALMKVYACKSLPAHGALRLLVDRGAIRPLSARERGRFQRATLEWVIDMATGGDTLLDLLVGVDVLERLEAAKLIQLSDPLFVEASRIQIAARYLREDWSRNTRDLGPSALGKQLMREIEGARPLHRSLEAIARRLLRRGGETAIPALPTARRPPVMEE